MTTPAEQAVNLLHEHARTSIQDCLCGWAELGKSHTEHVVRALVNAGLIATETETRQHYACSPDGIDDYCDTAFLTGHCEHEIPQTRNVTPWSPA